jgi:hypothetical protein
MLSGTLEQGIFENFKKCQRADFANVIKTIVPISIFNVLFQSVLFGKIEH